MTYVQLYINASGYNGRYVNSNKCEYLEVDIDTQGQIQVKIRYKVCKIGRYIVLPILL